MLFITSNGRVVESSAHIPEDTATIEVLKEDIAAKLEVEKGRLMLSVKNELLEDDNRTLRSYGVESNEEIKVLISPVTIPTDYLVGSMWSYREQMFEVEIHKELVNWIYVNVERRVVSIILSRENEEIVDEGDTIKLTSDNEILARNTTIGSNFKIIRKLRLKAEKNPYPLEYTFRYDGKYRVFGHNTILGINGHQTWCYSLRRDEVIPVIEAGPRIEDTFGPIAGIEVGYLWYYRVQAKRARVHREHMKGIATLEGKATAIAISGKYKANSDNIHLIVYTGSNSSFELSGENQCLARNCNEHEDNNGKMNKNWKESTDGVRVLRKLQIAEDNPYSRLFCFRYDGIYKVVGYWIETQWRFLLARHDDSPLIRPENFAETTEKKDTNEIKEYFDEIEVGAEWSTREEMAHAKVHTNLEANISKNSEGYATSLLLSNKIQMNLIIKQNYIIYTGSNENDLDKALAKNCFCAFDQRLQKNGNVAEECEKGFPVRVFRYWWKTVYNESDANQIAREVYRYEGTYHVIAYWPETRVENKSSEKTRVENKSSEKTRVWRYVLVKKDAEENNQDTAKNAVKKTNKNDEIYLDPMDDDQTLGYILDLSSSSRNKL
ncbi:uncharacterized protein LOC111693211 [Trichogramma pretiosum]|uniref:uncharacterized protein LOC111693211 n=1 Tax=Trichogramma pretiosum TaxID=7493 RepID=UPI0006C9CF86|nr:uncharacterized protein LOC111693211 [Trichogramma pretiosum]